MNYFKQSIEKEIHGQIFAFEELKVGSHCVCNVFSNAKYVKYDLTETANTKYIKIHKGQRRGVAKIVSVSVSTDF